MTFDSASSRDVQISFGYAPWPYVLSTSPPRKISNQTALLLTLVLREHLGWEEALVAFFASCIWGAEATVGAGMFRTSDWIHWSAMANDPVAQEAEVGSCRKKAAEEQRALYRFESLSSFFLIQS